MLSFEIAFHCTAKEMGAKAAFIFLVADLAKKISNVGEMI